MPKKRSLADINIKKSESHDIPSDKIIIFDSIDKKHNEYWTKGRSFINKPRPYRACFIAPPNSGKSSMIKNLLLHAKPEFSKVFVWGNSSSREWEDFSDMMITAEDLMEGTDILTEDIDGQRLLIIDDVELQHVNSKLKDKITLLFKHISSHYQLSIVVAVQDYKMIDHSIRSNLNVFSINLGIRDIESISNLGKRIGLSYTQFKTLFKDLKDCVDDTQYSYLVVDNTIGTPVPLAVNFFDKINIDDFVK